MIYGDYLGFLGIDRDLKYCGIYDIKKEILFDVKYNLRDALGLSWDDCIFKDISNIKKELIFKLNDSINEYVFINQEEFYDAAKDYEGYINKKNVEADFINGYTNYKYSSNISDLSTDDILKCLDNENYIFDLAYDHIQKNKKYIGERLKDIDLQNDYLESIIRDKNHSLYKAKKIKESLGNTDIVNVHVFINKKGIDYDFKYDRTSLIYSLSNSYISVYNMTASERKEYEEIFGRNTAFNFKDIYKIEYRNKPIYIDDNFNEKESSIEEYAL